MNFLPEVIQLSKEVRNLKNLGFRVPLAIVNKAQKAVDDLSLHAYSNLHAWVANLNESVETKLASRLDAGIRFVLALCLVSPFLCLLFCPVVYLP